MFVFRDDSVRDIFHKLYTATEYFPNFQLGPRFQFYQVRGKYSLPDGLRFFPYFELGNPAILPNLPRMTKSLIFLLYPANEWGDYELKGHNEA